MINIDNITDLQFTCEKDDSFITITLFDGVTEIGGIRIKSERAAAFIFSLQNICRELHNVYQPNSTVKTTFDNLSSGSIHFIE